MRYCDAPMGSGYPCGDPARFRAWARDDRSDEKHTCAQHLAKVVRSILAAADLPHWVVARVKVLDPA